MRVIVAFSGGKDSLACLIWACREYGASKIQAVFCDTGWEHVQTYAHIAESCVLLGVELVTLRSKKYKNFVDMAKKKGRFPSTKARFCTEELKTKPMIDYILSLEDHVLVIQGIRGDESASRAKMNAQCRYFRYYFEPYGYDKKGNPKYHTYRKRDVIAFCDKYADDVLRPIFEWTGQQTMQYIIEAGMKPNPLYYQGAKRVGCYPCIMSGHGEIQGMIKHNHGYVQRLRDAEAMTGSTFFPPYYIPQRYMTQNDQKTGKPIPSIDNVVKYITDKNENFDLFEDDKEDRRCMSFYGICE